MLQPQALSLLSQNTSPLNYPQNSPDSVTKVLDAIAAVPGLFASLRRGASTSTWMDLCIFDVRDTPMFPDINLDFINGLSFINEGSFLLEAFQSSNQSSIPNDPEFSLFIDAIMSGMERLFVKTGVVRLKQEFLITPSFYGSKEALGGFAEATLSNTPLVSIIPRINFVGSSILCQFRVACDAYRSLTCSDLCRAKEYPLQVILLPFGVPATVIMSSNSNHCNSSSKSNTSSLWTSLLGFPSDFVSSYGTATPDIPDFVTVEFTKDDGEIIQLLFPSCLVVVPLSKSSNGDDLYNAELYLDNFRDWRWSDEVATMFDGQTQTAAPQEDRVIDFWRYMNPYQRLLESGLGDGGAVEQAIRNKEATEAARNAQPKPIPPPAPQHPSTTVNNARPIVTIPTVLAPPQAQPSPTRASTDLDLTLHFSKGNGSDDFKGLELDDVGENDWDFFQEEKPTVVPVPVKQAAPATPAPIPLPSTSTSTPAATFTSIVGAAASPAISLPACSPAAAVTPGITTILSPMPFTPNYPNHPSSLHMSTAVQPTPDPTTPGVFAIAEDSTIEHSHAMQHHHPPPTSASTLPIEQPSSETSLSSSKHPFDVSSLVRHIQTRAEIEAESRRIVPEAWRTVNLDFGVVWKPGDAASTSTTSKYGEGGKYVYQCVAAMRKRAGTDTDRGGGKHRRVEVQSDSGSSSSGDDDSSDEDSSGEDEEGEVVESGRGGGGDDMMEEDEVLEDGEVMHLQQLQQQQGRPNDLGAIRSAVGGVAGTVSGSSLGRVVPKSEAESQLALQIMVESMTVGRGSVWTTAAYNNSGALMHEAFVNSLKPAFENRLFQFFGSVLSDLFAGMGLSGTSGGVGSGGVGEPSTVRGPLTIEQIYDYTELDRGASKYGKFQVKKKKRPEPILDLLRIPNIIVQHNNIPITVNPSALRLWDKLSLAPICGTKNVEYLFICPGGNKILTSNLRRWVAEVSNIWDFHNFGSLKPLSDYRNTDEESFCQVRVTVPRDDARLKAYSDTIEHLATDLSRILQHRISTSQAPFQISVFLINPFPHGRHQTTFDFYLMASRLLQSISRISELPLKYLVQVIIPVILPIQFALPRLSDTPVLLDMKEFVFGLFSRCRVSSKPIPIKSNNRIQPPSQHSLFRRGFHLHPYVLGRQPGSGAAGSGFILQRALDQPLMMCLSDPDRILHVVYQASACGRWVGVCWSDSFGELVDCCVLRIGPSGFLGALAELWERSIDLVVASAAGSKGSGIAWRIVVGVVVGGKSGVSGREIQGFEQFLDYLSTTQNPDHKHTSINSVSFVSLGMNPPVTTVDPGAVLGQSGGGTSQYFLSSCELLTTQEKRKDKEKESNSLLSSLASTDVFSVPSPSGGGATVGGAPMNEERLVPDGDATYIFLSKNHRMPIGNMLQISMNGDDLMAQPHLTPIIPPNSQAEDGLGAILPLAGGYLLTVPRRETAPPNSSGIGSSPASTNQLPQPVGQSPAASTNVAGGVLKAPLLPPEGSKSISIAEVSLLYHCNLNVQTSATCYKGWTPETQLPHGRSSGLGGNGGGSNGASLGGGGNAGLDGVSYSSPTSSSSSTPSSFNVLSNGNTPILMPANIKANLSPSLPASIALQQQQQQQQQQQYLQFQSQQQQQQPTTPQPSTPFNLSGQGGSNTATGTGTCSNNAPAPQGFHTVILRDIMKEYHGLRYVHRGAGFCNSSKGGTEPWIFAMAEIAASCATKSEL
ncbi:Mediator of RNA polymerase II transcription subunit 13-like [Rhizoclosmatium sp. JEL0117]|nr:Mediator of RNA polymerase II transcription subunit 13-like [Rhizoclosmatium sp. JEL0117]